MSEEPKIRRGSRVMVAKLYGDGMPSCCVSDDDLFDLIADRETGTVVRVAVARDLADGDVPCVDGDAPVAVVVLDGLADDQYDADRDGMPLVAAWLIPVACLREVSDG